MVSSVAAAAVVAGAFFLTPRTAPEQPVAPKAPQEAQVAAPKAPVAAPATNVAYVPQATSEDKQPAAATTSAPTARHDAPKPKAVAPQTPQAPTQQPLPATKPAEVSPEDMQAVENLLAKRLEELRRQEQMIEELLRNYEETQHKQPRTI